MIDNLEANLEKAAQLAGGGRKRGRPRSKEAHERIINATLELLSEKGFSSVTIEAVARNAKVGKSTIYRHWKTKVELVEEALGQEFDKIAIDGFSGNFENDLKGVVIKIVQLFEGRNGTAISRLIGEAQTIESLSLLVDRRWRAFKDRLLTKSITHGIEQRYLQHGLDPKIVTEMAFGMVLARKMLSKQSLSPADVDQVVATLLRGIIVTSLG